MSNIVDCTGDEVCSAPPRVVGVEPFGSLVMIEHLRPEEVLSTKILVSEKMETGSPPQAYIVKFGPKVPQDCGLALGDRVIIQGSYIPVVNYDNNPRERGLVEIHSIKAILKEESSV